MASEKEQYIDAVVKLIKLTQEGKIKWTPQKPRDSLNRDAGMIVDVFYSTQYNDRRLGLYESRYKVEAPASGTLSGFSGIDFSRLFGLSYPYWTSKVVLEIIDDSGKSLWTFPDVSGLSDLLNAVKYQVADVKGLIEDILKDDDPGNGGHGT